MDRRYKNETFHMMETFNKKHRQVAEEEEVSKQAQSLSLVMKGKAGNTWDAHHLTNFLSSSHYSNWSEAGGSSYSNSQKKHHHRSGFSGDHFFRTTTDNKNESKIGFTKINPMVTIPKSSEHHKEVLKEHLERKSPERYSLPRFEMRESGRFRFEANSVKFRQTNPLTFQNVEERNPSQSEKTRLMWLMEKRHPHGMTGIDHPENPEAIFYPKIDVDSVRLRKEPNHNRRFDIDSEWKTKKRVAKPSQVVEYGAERYKLKLQRKFNNDDAHGYNILTNRFSDGRT